MRVVILTFVMLAAPAVAGGMSDGSHDVALFADHVGEVAVDQVDLQDGSVELDGATYVARLRLVDLAPSPSDANFQFHAEADFRIAGARRFLASMTVEADGDLFVVGYENARVIVPATGTYDAATDTITMRLSPANAGAAPMAEGARAALFHCVPGEGCSRAVLGPQTGYSTAAIYDEMGSVQGDAFVRADV